MVRRSILFVIGSLSVGGAERHVANLAISLKKRGWDPALFVLAPGGPLTGYLLENEIPIHAAKIPAWVTKIANDSLRARIGLLFTAGTLFAYLWTRRPWILHFFLPAAYIVGGLVSLVSPVRCKVMSRRSLNYYQKNHHLFAKIERRLHQHMSLILANSLAVQRDLTDEGVDPKKLRLIYNGIDTSAFSAPPDRLMLREAENISASAFVMVMVANLIPYKGHNDLLTALGQIKDHLPDGWRLICVGRDDGIQNGLVELSSELGISENVRFLGPRSDVANLLSIADIGLLTSHQEGFSNSVLEGMAAGLPMLVTDVGGNAEAVQDGVSGIVVPARSPSELGNAILQLLDAQRRSAFGLHGRERVMNLFSLEACVDRYEAVYQEGIERR